MNLPSAKAEFSLHKDNKMHVFLKNLKISKFKTIKVRTHLAKLQRESPVGHSKTSF